uniref:Cysteine protease n=1 Tax=Esox lucius TaxID=8010 RepID=A0AAY5KC34_ESOLU
MNSVSPSAAQYVGGVVASVVGQDNTLQGKVIRGPMQASPVDPGGGGSFGNQQGPHLGGVRAMDANTAGEPDEVDKLKAKLMSAWNNVKYGWSVKSKTTFNKNSPVTVMGHSYVLNCEDEVERFRLAFVSRLWLTYRREFPQLDGSAWTTDCGWGCMLRSGQMLLAQGLLVHLLPRDWSWPSAQEFADVDFEALRPRSPSRAGGVPIPSFGYSSSPRTPTMPQKTPMPGDTALKRGQKTRPEAGRHSQSEPLHRRLVAWFGDVPPAPFGLHQLVELGRSSGKKAGDWYGPSVVAHILQKAVAQTSEVQNLVVYVAQDCTGEFKQDVCCQIKGEVGWIGEVSRPPFPVSLCLFPTVYKGDVVCLCDQSLTRGMSVPEPSGSDWTSVIILVPVRLGGESLNPSYIQCVKNILRLKCCIGIIGGKPKHSLFFIGCQDDQLLYLDPHYCQAVVDVTQGNFPLESFHCSSPRKMPFSRMDPSCTIGFYARTKKDFETLCGDVSEALSSSKEKYPIFTFVEGQGPDYGLASQSSSHLHSDTSPSPAHILPTGKLNKSNNRGSLDEFVFL